MAAEARALLQVWPGLAGETGFEAIGDFPTRVESLRDLVAAGGDAWKNTFVKRDDLTSPVYGGNKVRTLEPLFWQARREGRLWVYATGAYGSNHAVATVLHGKRLGFRTGVMLFPQPFSIAARENLEVSLGADHVVDLFHWSALPLSMWRRGRLRAEGPAFIMRPGGAIPRGALGFLSAGLELGQQVAAGQLPCPAEVVLGLGSTCSTAGLLLGLSVAARLGIGFSSQTPPLLVAVRVTPWPVTSRYRILGLAMRVARWLAQLSGDKVFQVEAGALARGLTIEGRYLGAGYGRPTPGGLCAIERLAPFSRALDTTYAAKSAAALLDRVETDPGVPRVYWATKSSAPLPPVSEELLAAAPPRMRRWFEREDR